MKEIQNNLVEKFVLDILFDPENKEVLEELGKEMMRMTYDASDLTLKENK